MAADKKNQYDEDFKRSLVTLYHNGKTQTQLCKEYGVSQSALGSGTNNTPLLRLMMAKSLQQSK